MEKTSLYVMYFKWEDYTLFKIGISRKLSDRIKKHQENYGIFLGISVYYPFDEYLPKGSSSSMESMLKTHLHKYQFESINTAWKEDFDGVDGRSEVFLCNSECLREFDKWIDINKYATVQPIELRECCIPGILSNSTDHQFFSQGWKFGKGEHKLSDREIKKYIENEDWVKGFIRSKNSIIRATKTTPATFGIRGPLVLLEGLKDALEEFVGIFGFNINYENEELSFGQRKMGRAYSDDPNRIEKIINWLGSEKVYENLKFKWNKFYKPANKDVTFDISFNPEGENKVIFI